MSEEPQPQRNDPILLAEVLLGLLLLGLFIALYVVPAAELPFDPDWWVAPLLGALFFGLLALDLWRRKRRSRAALREALREERKKHGL